MTVIEKYVEGKFVLPCVVDSIDYEKQMVIDVIQHKDQLFRKGMQLSYKGFSLEIHKKLKDYPVQTNANLVGRLDFRKVRYYCNKI